MRDATRIIRSTITPVVAGEPIHHGPVFAAPFHAPGDPTNIAYTYARSHNPTWTALEAAISQMESSPESGAGFGARTLVYGSGISATAAVFAAVLRPGDVAVLPSDCYFGARALLEQSFVPMGIEMRTARTAGDAQAALLEAEKGRVKLLWLESPSNPTMDVCDIAALSDAAHRAGALVGVDNTTPTPLGQSPLTLGTDFSMCSDTKLMTGHGDLLAGHVSVRSDATDSLGNNLYDKLLQGRTNSGSILGPMEAWLALRSLATLPLRLERSCANALALAEFLATRPEVSRVMYPGLRSHPAHAIARRQMRYFGPVLSFVLRDKSTAERFISSAELITDATSFGAIHTTAERRARWGHDDIPEGLVRLSAGCEAIEDLIDDIAQALVSSAAG